MKDPGVVQASFWAHLEALRADLLPLLHPGDARLGFARRLAHKRSHAARNPRLIVGRLDEVGQT